MKTAVVFATVLTLSGAVANAETCFFEMDYESGGPVVIASVIGMTGYEPLAGNTPEFSEWELESLDSPSYDPDDPANLAHQGNGLWRLTLPSNAFYDFDFVEVSLQPESSCGATIQVGPSTCGTAFNPYSADSAAGWFWSNVECKSKGCKYRSGSVDAGEVTHNDFHGDVSKAEAVRETLDEIGFSGVGFCEGDDACTGQEECRPYAIWPCSGNQMPVNYTSWDEDMGPGFGVRRMGKYSWPTKLGMSSIAWEASCKCLDNPPD